MLIFGRRLHEPVRHAKPDTDEASQVPYKGRLHVHGVSDCARLLVAKPFRREDVAFSSSNWIGTSEFDRFAARYPAHGLPCERFKLSLAASPCITRGRGGCLGLPPWRTCTSYPLPAFLAHSVQGHSRHDNCSGQPLACPLCAVCDQTRAAAQHVANGMDRPRSRPQRLSECVGGLSGAGAPPCLARPPFTQ